MFPAGLATIAGCVGFGTGAQVGLERQITRASHGHILTNTGVWSPDGQWIIYDVREKEDVFSGDRIERVNVETGEVEVIYRSRNGARCGVATYSPTDDKVVFIHGPENPTPEWSYAANRRRGFVVDLTDERRNYNLDARDLTEPLTPGALRGGTHVHVFSGDGSWVSFTYEDYLLEQFREEKEGQEINLRNVGVSVPKGPVTVKRDHPRNHDGEYFSVLVSRTVAEPTPGSDEISRAFSDAWVGTDGYRRPDGTRQRKAIAFQGEVRTDRGETIAEVFIADLPDDLTVQPEDGRIEGTTTTRPRPPKGVVQRRLTRTADRHHPGIQGPRHWVRSSPDGSRIAFYMKDDAGTVQLWTISPNGGEPVQVTSSRWDPTSAFSWSPDGRRVAYAMDNSIFVTDVETGQIRRITPRVEEGGPTHHACVFSPDGRRVAYMRPVTTADGRVFDQIFVAKVDKGRAPAYLAPAN